MPSIPTRVAMHGGTINAYTYDTSNRLATVGDGDEFRRLRVSCQFAAGQPASVQAEQSTTTRMTTVKQYDGLNRLQSISSVPLARDNAKCYLLCYDPDSRPIHDSCDLTPIHAIHADS